MVANGLMEVGRAQTNKLESISSYYVAFREIELASTGLSKTVSSCSADISRSTCSQR